MKTDRRSFIRKSASAAGALTLLNLLDNAAQAFDEGGVITINTCLTQDGWVEIQVSDNGCGIPAENLSKLFTPFFTTKNSPLTFIRP